MLDGILALIVGNFLGAAINPVFVKIGVREIPPLTFTTIRFVIAAVVFYPVFQRGSHKGIVWRDVLHSARYTVFFSFNIILFAFGIQHTTAVMSMILYAQVPIIVGLVSHFVLGERMKMHQIIGTTIAMAGILFLFFQSVGSHANIEAYGTLYGNILILIGVFSWSVFFISCRRLMRRYSTATISFYSYVVTAAICAAAIPYELLIQRAHIVITQTGIFSALMVGIGGSAIMFYCTQYGLKRTGPFTAALFSYLGPLFGAVTAIPLLHEKITINLILGGLLILMGVFYASMYERITRLKLPQL